MYVITQKDNNYCIGICNNLIDNNDGSFLNVDEDVMYYKGDYTYYSDVDVAPGIQAYQYKYTKEKGFELAFNQLDLIKARLAFVNSEKQSTKTLYENKKILNKFHNEKEMLDNNIGLLTDESYNNQETLLLIQDALCEIYELIVNN